MYTAAGQDRATGLQVSRSASCAAFWQHQRICCAWLVYDRGYMGMVLHCESSSMPAHFTSTIRASPLSSHLAQIGQEVVVDAVQQLHKLAPVGGVQAETGDLQGTRPA